MEIRKYELYFLFSGGVYEREFVTYYSYIFSNIFEQVKQMMYFGMFSMLWLFNITFLSMNLISNIIFLTNILFRAMVSISNQQKSIRNILRDLLFIFVA